MLIHIIGYFLTNYLIPLIVKYIFRSYRFHIFAELQIYDALKVKKLNSQNNSDSGGFSKKDK